MSAPEGLADGAFADLVETAFFFRFFPPTNKSIRIKTVLHGDRLQNTYFQSTKSNVAGFGTKFPENLLLTSSKDLRRV